MTNNEDAIAVESNGDPNDFIEIVIKKKSTNKLRISVKYNKNRDLIRSFALIFTIKKLIKT